MIHFPTRVEDIGDGEIRAGGTDLVDRQKRRISVGPTQDLRDLSGLDTSDIPSGAAIGARVRLSDLTAHPEIQRRYAALAEAAGSLATPQIRARATVGGALLQRTRCSYFRDTSVSCYKRGGSTCPARAGDRVRLAAIESSPCLSVHPSTLAAVLIAYDATTRIHAGPAAPIAALYGDGSDPTRDHQLPPGAVLIGVDLPSVVDERSAYLRITGRTHAEWPLVEIVGRRGPGVLRLVVGGIAGVPIDLSPVAGAIAAGRAWEPAWRRMALTWRLSEPAAYKLDLVEAAIHSVLERLA